MQAIPTPTSDELSKFSISAFKGIEAGLGQADPVATIAQKLEEKGEDIAKKLRK